MKELLQNPLVAALLIAALVAFLLTPIVLRVAGLNGEQIREVLKDTAQFFLSLVRVKREENRGNKNDQ